MNEQYDVVVIGGGAAGMMAAGTAARRGKSVLVVEKNKILGKKLLITGKGRCNITNAADISEFFDQIPKNPSFLYSALYGFSNQDLLALLGDLSLTTKTERGGRVFPASDRSADVVAALSRYMKDAGVLCGEVTKVLQEDGAVCGVRLKTGEEIACNSVILATGGASYPKTGSTGDGYRIAKALGHTVTTLVPSLVPLCAEDSFVADLQGLSLKNVQVTLYQAGKKVAGEFGEMLFTHFGVSGPAVLTLSAHMEAGKDTWISIDLKPALDEKQLDLRLLRDFEKYANRDFCNALDDLLPRMLIPVTIKLAAIEPHTKVHQLTKAQRHAFCRLLKDFRVRISKKRPLDEAIITSGGIKVGEINPTTMESKKLRGLYFAGEVIDVDAYTGGFNLQIAFSTGYLAGMHA